MRSRAVVVSALFILLVDGLIVWVVALEHGEALATAQRSSQRLVQLLEEQTRKAFQTADLVLMELKDDLERSDSPGTAGLPERLHARTTALPHVRSLLVVGPDGFVIRDSTHLSAPHTSIAKSDYFAIHREKSAAGIFVGAPAQSAPADRSFIPLSRRVERGGKFAGVVVAALEPDFFESIYQDLKLNSRHSVLLFHTDGTLLARFPPVAGPIGSKKAHQDLFQHHQPKGRRGTFEAPLPERGASMVSYSKVAPLPLVTAVTLNRADVLAPWRRTALAWGLIGLTGTILLAGYGLTVERQRRERQAALKRALRAQKMEALGQMTGGIAHDFRNVLSVVGASFRLMRRSGADERYISAGEQALERGARLTAQLLNFASRHELSCTAEDANELLRSLQPMIKQAAGAGKRITYALDAAVRPCLVDRAQFDSAIINLVVNASQAMADSGEIVISTREITIGARRSGRLAPGQYVAVCVKDHGCGIAPGDLKRVFEPFYTTKKDVGTGLGLSQVYASMHQIGGDVRIDSKVGVGTTVELLFPTRARHAKAPEAAVIGQD